MTASIDRLLSVLRASGVDLTPAEVAEALWLAGRVDLSGLAPGPAVTTPGAPADPPRRPEERVELRLPVEPEAPDPGAPGEPPSADGPGEAPAPDGQVTFAAVPGRPLRFRTAEALPHSGRTMHALRPLKRQRLSPRRVALDEEATARQIAERRLWTPVWRPAPERWLHLTLVLDDTSVSGVWHRLGQEVRTMLERLGAFRTMRVVHLGLGDDGEVRVTRPGGARRSPPNLADRPGDHLVLLLGDCVGTPWHDGRMSRLLGRWSRSAPVAVLQPLPERLWSRTGLAPLPGRLFAPRAGAPASAYSFVSARRRRRLPDGSVPVPVLEIHPRWLTSWAHLVAGRTAGGIDAVVTPAGEVARPRRTTAGPSAEPAAEHRIRDFRAGASAPAYELARYLTVARPLSLAVMRLMQTVMLPGSLPSNLAEVLYGGLLRPLEASGAGADEQQFEFLPGVRHVLRESLEAGVPDLVHAAVSGYLEQHPERTGALFTALASLPRDGRDVPGAAEAFAGIDAEVLRRIIGGTGGTALPVRRAREQLTVLHLHGPATAVEVAPDLVVVTGGVADRATPGEYRAAHARLERLRAGLGLPPGRIVVVPGPSDVNEGRCRAYFRDQEADGLEPVPPYWPKWEPFAALTGQLPGGTPFQQHQPWQLYEFPALRTVVAALNSTIPISHLPGERHGGLGTAQVTWFADRLRDHADRGYLRIGVVHHDPVLATALAPHLDVILHGQDSGVHELELTGVPAVGAPEGAQLVELRPGALRVSGGGRTRTYAFGDHWWLTGDDPPAAPPVSGAPVGVERTDLLGRVAAAYRARRPDVPLAEQRPPEWPDGYLIVTPSGERRCAGVFDGDPDADVVERFVAEVVRRERPNGDAALVCRRPADATLEHRALDRGVRVTGLAEFQIGDHLLDFVREQAGRLAAHPRYRPELYLSPAAGDTDLLTLLRARTARPGGGIIAVSGDSGTGKSFLLRELARVLPTGDDPVVPILLDPPERGRRAPLDELIAARLVRGGAREVDAGHIRYLLAEGRFVLLCDGLDDIGVPSGYDSPRPWPIPALDGFTPWMVLVSRNESLLGEACAAYPADRVHRVRLDGSGAAEILG
ncbi:hypothetical protein Ait01nite_056540 [Actinoplanes italicus]|uniref:NACHT domain-containing protein n=1 Tax=Actinoplanes italicus TaxID=113567 RepID=A0A2T0K5G6_9ACTN|nr:SAV_2336 N-terminal domain-related protein [Actinoplanes italicus]PRX18204.1 hypothetical protein CLV67_11337 [Actinoplanes italicus]GIE32609.1 hypothetical protein Ait01nite_056540 [Actinoplanes italicus]